RLVSTGADVIVVFCSLLCDADVFIKLLLNNNTSLFCVNVKEFPHDVT
ncbi:unnamed protein product, partial [Tenebrio molitor]